jgi:hypothetical protein
MTAKSEISFVERDIREKYGQSDEPVINSQAFLVVSSWALAVFLRE